MTAQVDADHAVGVGEPARQRIEEARAQAVGMEEQQRLAVAAPVEGGDAETVVLDDDGRGVGADDYTGSAARMAPSFKSCGVAPPSVSSSFLANKKYRCSG
jgi:hypothetical protein